MTDNLESGLPERERVAMKISNAGFGPDYSFQRPAPTVRDAIKLIEKMDKCEGMPAKLILLRNFILKIAGRLSDWP